ncbi:asparagine synthetase B [Terrabacter tumescens]|uniref:asparagine synthase (glutamine-hydrolyzing) n=1 Tax=Terrabacter tumescens TaxID=60443 RepID=A0ABQ2IHM7_9MICO|nr:asparagine synthase (glutamine-hydrolyzing) [Terrabacter tumescens]GGN09429.1 asparagine synthetase B [Terrabacter tumescens]
MCGIAGIVHPDPRVRGSLSDALMTIRHRGPDEQGQADSGFVALGMTRLSVIDIDGGHQPMISSDGNLTVIFNGEIYNYREIAVRLLAQGCVLRTDSDTEVLLHLYEMHGDELVQHLRGMFAFVLYDARRNRLLMGRDRLGKKPLYYAQPDQKTLFFASELKALRPLAVAAGMPLRVSSQAIYDYLSFGVVPQPSTIFDGVQILPAGSIGTFENGLLDIASYWSPAFTPKLDIPYAEAQDQARALIRDAVNIRLRSDVPLGVLLSGGLDSSIVAYEAVAAGARDLQTFTVATGGTLDESAVAQRTAAHLGVASTVLPLQVDPLAGIHRVVKAYDQPYADSSAIATMQISELARQHVTVALNGDGGDEVFGGYRRYVAAASFGRLDGLGGVPIARAAQALGHFSAGRRSALGFASRLAAGLSLTPDERYLSWTTDMLRETDKAAWWHGAGCAPSERLVAGTRRPDLSHLDQSMLSDVTLNLRSDLLVKMDIGTMSASLEARSPFLDHEVASFGWALQAGYRVRGRTTKRILRDAYRSDLPQEVLGGAKRGFEVPMQQWLDGPLRPLLLDTLTSGSARLYEFLDRDLVRGLLDGHGLPDRNRTYVVYALLVLELWLQEQSTEDLASPGCRVTRS